MIEVRRVRPDEYLDAGEVTASAWEPAEALDEERWLSFRSQVADIAGRDSVAFVYVATNGGRILGSVTLETGRRIDSENPKPLAPQEAHVRVLGVTPEARRQGDAGLLMNYCADVARRQGKDTLTLNTSVENAVAQSFYEAIGYVRLPDVDLKDGSRVCAYELNLNAR